MQTTTAVLHLLVSHLCGRRALGLQIYGKWALSISICNNANAAHKAKAKQKLVASREEQQLSSSHTMDHVFLLSTALFPRYDYMSTMLCIPATNPTCHANENASNKQDDS